MVLAGQVSATSRRELPKRKRTCRMAALTRDFHFFASRVTTSFSAVFFSIQYIAEARYVCALLAFLIRHFGSFLSKSLLDS
jgi:hypothetical protein